MTIKVTQELKINKQIHLLLSTILRFLIEIYPYTFNVTSPSSRSFFYHGGQGLFSLDFTLIASFVGASVIGHGLALLLSGTICQNALLWCMTVTDRHHRISSTPGSGSRCRIQVCGRRTTYYTSIPTWIKPTPQPGKIQRSFGRNPQMDIRSYEAQPTPKADLTPPSYIDSGMRRKIQEDPTEVEKPTTSVRMIEHTISHRNLHDRASYQTGISSSLLSS